MSRAEANVSGSFCDFQPQDATGHISCISVMIGTRVVGKSQIASSDEAPPILGQRDGQEHR